MISHQASKHQPIAQKKQNDGLCATRSPHLRGLTDEIMFLRVVASMNLDKKKGYVQAREQLETKRGIIINHHRYERRRAMFVMP